MNRLLRVPVPALLIVTSAVLLAGCDKPPQGDPAGPLAVGVYTISEQPLALTTELPGRTAAFRTAEVRPQVSGILLKRLFTEGSNVKAGQQLYQIDSASYAATLDKAKATLAAAENLARRYGELRPTNAISQQQYDDAMSAWQQAQADVKTASINVVYTQVLSPIAGRIGRSSVTEGALLTNGQAEAMATVQQIDPIYVDLTQSTGDILKLQGALARGELEKAGANATKVGLALEDGSKYPLSGKLDFSELTVDQGTGSVVVRATFPNPDGKLLPGMFVHATLHTAMKSKAMLVPQQAVTRNSKGQPVVWAVADDSTVSLREIETARTVGNSWLVEKGLKPGERVVSEGLQRLRPGMKVEASAAQNVELVADLTVATKDR